MRFLKLLIPFSVLASQWTPDDLLLSERDASAVVSRDARWVVWVKSQMDKDKGESISNLVLRNLVEDWELQITRGKENYSSPTFSPDSRKIAFLTSRKNPDDKSDASGLQIWTYDLRGGEPSKLTSFDKGVRAFRWLSAEAILVAASESATLHDQKIKDRKDTSQVVDDEAHAAPVRLFRFDLKSRTATRLTTNSDRISSLAVSDDGLWAVTTNDRSLHFIYDQQIKPVTFLHDLKSGSAVQLFPDGKLQPSQVTFRNDSKGFYFVAPYTTDPQFRNAAIRKLYYYDLASSAAAEIPLDWERALGGDYAVTKDGFVAILADGARNKPAVYTQSADGKWTRQWLSYSLEANLRQIELAPDSQSALLTFSNASKPPQLYTAQLMGDRLDNIKPITSLNKGWEKKEIAKSELITWKGARDEQVEGILLYPHGYQTGKKYPLVVMIHGGPHGHDADSFNDGWAYPHQLFSQRGAFILKPNYHGSSNYGLKWGESIANGNYNELEWIDVERGVDHLIAKGWVDSEKLGVMGWSNGSIITIELTTRTTRYKVASAGAGDVNWISDWGNAVFGHAFDKYYLGKTPLEDPQLYLKKSPLFRMDKVRTPTIIFFGTEDKQVPTEQGWQHYRALQQLGKTDVRFILFPGEAHGPRKYVHQRRKMDEELAWFDRYLFKTLPDSNEAIKPESPLSAALKRRAEAAKMEFATRGNLKIARFEVTRSQFAEFKPGYPTGDLPASGVSFEDAKRFCEWLSSKTGMTYRLGTEEELKDYLKPSKSENTLDAWAGYTVNPDDASRLASLVEGLGPGALLKPVGSSPGQGDDPIFDLGGNVAEWVVTKDGQGKPLGGSADRPADPAADAKPRPDYIGFRVVAN